MSNWHSEYLDDLGKNKTEIVPTASEETQAWSRSERIKALRRVLEQSFLELAEQLYHFNEEKQYLILGHLSLNSYCADPDIDINVRTAYRLIGVYKKYVLDLEVSPMTLIECGHTKLEMLRPYITESNHLEYINMAATLSKSDIIKELKDKEPDYEPPALIIDYDLVTVAWIEPKLRETVSPEEITLKDAKVTRATSNFFLQGTIIKETP